MLGASGEYGGPTSGYLVASASACYLPSNRAFCLLHVEGIAETVSKNLPEYFMRDLRTTGMMF